MGLFGMLCAGFSFIGCLLFCKVYCKTDYDNNENNINNYHYQNDRRPLIVHEIVVNPNEYANERLNECDEPNGLPKYEQNDKPPNYDSVMNSLPNDDVFY